MNENIRSYLANEYNKYTYTHNYIFGLKIGERFVIAFCDNCGRDFVDKISRVELRSSGWELKIHNTQEVAQYIVNRANKVVDYSSRKEFEELYAESRKVSNKNRGYYFEQICADMFNGITSKNPCEKFFVAGDMVINGKSYQLKLYNGSICTEKTIKNIHAMEKVGA